MSLSYTNFTKRTTRLKGLVQVVYPATQIYREKILSTHGLSYYLNASVLSCSYRMSISILRHAAESNSKSGAYMVTGRGNG